MTAIDAPAPRAVLDPPPLAALRRGWVAWLGPVVSLGLLLVVLREFGRVRLDEDLSVLPANPLFWAVFVLNFLATPIGDWIIFRRLWSIPPSGIVALLRKHVTNRLLFGYLGEVYFYSWARRHGRLAAAPFGAIKDVAITSAVCGNLVAMTMVPLGYRLLESLVPQQHPWLLAGSVTAFAVMSLLPLVLGRTLFSLPGRELRFMAMVHGLRTLAGILLYAVLWHLMIPGKSFLLWMVLAGLRQSMMRLPFVPDDEVVFTTVAIFFFGHQSLISNGLAMFGSLSMALLLVSGLAIGVAGLVVKDGA